MKVLAILGILVFLGLGLLSLAPSASQAGVGISDAVSDIQHGDWTIVEPAAQPAQIAYWEQWGYASEHEALAALETIDAYAVEELMLAELTGTETLSLPTGWDLGSLKLPPQGAIDDLARAGHHAYVKHAIASCISHITQMGIAPVRTYFSAGAPAKGENYPSVAFLWHLDKALRDLAGTPGACAGMPNILQQEFGRVPIFTDVKLFMPVKFDPSRGWVTINAYPVIGDVLNSHLCEHNYYWQLYPSLKPVKCITGF